MLIRSSLLGLTCDQFSCSMYSEAPDVTAGRSTSVRTALVKAIALPAVQRRLIVITPTWVSLREAEFMFYACVCITCRGFCTLVHSLLSALGSL